MGLWRFVDLQLLSISPQTTTPTSADRQQGKKRATAARSRTFLFLPQTPCFKRRSLCTCPTKKAFYYYLSLLLRDITFIVPTSQFQTRHHELFFFGLYDMMDLVQRFSTAIPAARAFADDRPTLIVSWWCTCYSITIIVFRVCGRYVRTEKIFFEDGLMIGAVAFLVTRMGLVHAILYHGTNNTLVADFSDNDIARRELGSKLVLASRVMYAA